MSVITPIIVNEFNNVQDAYRVADKQGEGQAGCGLVDSSDEIINVEKDTVISFDDELFQLELQKYMLPPVCLALGPACYQRNPELINPGGLTVSDIVVEGDIDYSVPEILTPQQVSEDIDYTIYVLQTAYVGYYVLHDQVELVIQKLAELKTNATEMTPEELEYKIRDIFAIIPDNHLGILFETKSSHQVVGIAGQGPQSSFAENQLSDSWNIHDEIIRVARHDYVVPIIKLREMIVEDDPAFAPAVRAAVERSDALIIELWNNGGGDNPPESLISLLTDHDLIACDAYRLQSPEALAIRANQFENQKQLGEYVSQDRIDQRNEKFQQSLEKELPLWRFVSGDCSVTAQARNPYQKPIYVLINGSDGSTTEETIALLRQIPNVTLVGQATSGTAHYGGCGSAFLPNSRLKLWVGTRYVEYASNQYDDPTFIEQTGFQPDIVTRLSSRGGNRNRARKTALRELKKFFKLSHEIQEVFNQVSRLESMEPDYPYSALVEGEMLTGKKEVFLRRRIPQEILESGLSSGCGDKAAAFYYLMEQQGFQVQFIDAAEISEDSFQRHLSGHTGVAVYDPQSERWILTDPTFQEVIDDHWNPENKLYKDEFWIGYVGPLDQYPVHNIEQLEDFYARTLSMVPQIIYTIDPSFYSETNELFNPHVTQFIENQNETKMSDVQEKTGRWSPPAHVVVYPGQSDSGESEVGYDQDANCWKLVVGQDSAMSEGLMAYILRQVVQ